MKLIYDEVQRLSGVGFNTACLLLASALAGVLAHPGVIELAGMYIAGVGIATQLTFIIIALRVEGKSMVSKLTGAGIVGFVILFTVATALFFCISQILTLSGVIAPGVLVDAR